MTQPPQSRTKSGRGGFGSLRGWAVPLRMARRDAMRYRGRSILVLVMIALPVLAVTAADVVMHTADVRGRESIDRRMGSAAAMVSVQDGSGPVLQGPDPNESMMTAGGTAPMPTAAEVTEILGGDARLVERREGVVRVVSDEGVATAEGTELDLRDSVASGLFDLTKGRLPRSVDEVVVNQALADKGYAVGDRLELADDGKRAPVVVGIAESTTLRDQPIVAGQLDSIGLSSEGTMTWLVERAAVTWDDVRRLNAGGATVLSRAVVLDPPPTSEIPEEVRSQGGGMDQTTLAVALLVVVMALIEVVLLAGPAFAVGARRQARSLALLAATGATPPQTRHVVLASALVLGVTAALLGVAVGIGLAFLVLPWVQSISGEWFGSFQVPWLHLVAVVVFGVASALLAAVVPAGIASRQDVVAVLAGRRGDRAPSVRSPLVGAVLMGLGVAGAVVGTRAPSGELFIAGSAIVSVLGMILLIPVLLVGLSRVSGRLPLTLRYAVRDAARHRTRTVPAVAAVAATVAGVVALGISTSSDAHQNEATYEPALTAGAGALTSYGATPNWPAYRALVAREVPNATLTDVHGMPSTARDGSSTIVQLMLPGAQAQLLPNYGTTLGSDVLVSDGPLPPGLVGVSADDRARATAALRAKGLVAFTTSAVPAGSDQILVNVQSYDEDGDGSPSRERDVTVPATIIRLEGVSATGPQAIASSAAARSIGIPVGQVGLVVSGADISKADEETILEGVAAVSADGSFMVERGYQAEDETRIIQLILAGLGAILMLGGTLTATFLALSDARPDLATLSAVGASPRTRRGVAAAYALVVGVVGAALGAVVGFIPGIAVAFPLTKDTGAVTVGSGAATAPTGPAGPFIDVPWLLVLGLVVLLPLVTAAVVGMTARSRLPLVARLD